MVAAQNLLNINWLETSSLLCIDIVVSIKQAKLHVHCFFGNFVRGSVSCLLLSSVLNSRNKTMAQSNFSAKCGLRHKNGRKHKVRSIQTYSLCKLNSSIATFRMFLIFRLIFVIYAYARNKFNMKIKLLALQTGAV